MFLFLADIFCLLILLVLVLQDFRSRLVSAGLFPLLAVAFIVHRANDSWAEIFRDAGINLIILAVQLLLLSLYFSIRERKFVFIFDKLIGWGDVLFFVCLAVLFSPVAFIFFFCGALICSVLVAMLIVMKQKSSEEKTIPLIGTMALPLLILFAVHLFHPAQSLLPENWFYFLSAV